LHARVRLEVVAGNDDLLTLRGTLGPLSRPALLRYRTRAAALLRVGGAVVGAFDATRETVAIEPDAAARAIELEVELRGVPPGAPPSGPGLRWRLFARRSHVRPAATLEVLPVPHGSPAARSAEAAVEAGPARDTAWLRTYENRARTALRACANAVPLLETDPSACFALNEAWLCAYAAAAEPALFERLRALARERRFDAGGAALWVQADCRLPSGESLLRQLVFGMRYVSERLDTVPAVAWLPSGFAFANTLPTLLAHAGLVAFAAARRPGAAPLPPEFLWEGPDGSRVCAVLFESGPEFARATVAERIERRFAARGDVPVHSGELSLEEHPGVLTTHHDVKAAHAALERALAGAELLAAWCVAVHASPLFVEELRAQLREVWEIVLRSQSRDVIGGTAIGDVYRDVVSEYDRASQLVGSIMTAAASALPRAAPRAARGPRLVAPLRDGGDVLFDSDFLSARVRADGAIVELRYPGGPNVAGAANLLAAYRDAPRAREAWDLGPESSGRRLRLRPAGSEIEEEALVVRYEFGPARLSARISLDRGDPFLRVELTVERWPRRALLRCENWLAVRAEAIRCGAPHGSVSRPLGGERSAPAPEVCGQRFAQVHDGGRSGCAILALDTYGWSARRLEKGGVHLGHSLLRGTRWPDPDADAGAAHFSYAYAPLGTPLAAEAEQAWQTFAVPATAPLFRCDDPTVVVAATKPADDGDGVIVRVRECDGRGLEATIHCAARARGVTAVDALERPLDEAFVIADGAFRVPLAAHGLRSLRVTFG
jgi:alpha-mannosidase